MTYSSVHNNSNANILTQTLEQALDAVVCIDENNLITFFNSAAEVLWGFDRAEVIGENVSMLLPEILKSQHDRYINHNRKTGEDKIVGTSRDVEFLDRCGRTVYANLSISKISFENKILYTAFLKDKTFEIIKLQESIFLDSIYVHTDDLIVGLDSQGLIIQENANFNKYFINYDFCEKSIFDLITTDNNSTSVINRFTEALNSTTSFIDEVAIGLIEPSLFTVHLQPVFSGTFFSGHFLLNLKATQLTDFLYNENAYNIVIVEDDIVFCALYQDYFSRKSLNFNILKSFQEATDYLSDQTNKFDIVILDNQLLDGSGLDLYDGFKESNPYCGIIMVTGNEKNEFFKNAYDKGIDDFIRKPIVLDLLWIKCIRVYEKILTEDKLRKQKKQLELKVEQESSDQKLALYAFNSLFEMHNKHCPGVKSFISSESTFCGDNLLQAQSSSGCWYFMLADAMGHGLAAATSLMPIVEPFYNMARGNASLNKIVMNLNGLLERCLPDDRFVAAIIIRIDPYKKEVSCWNGGMPVLTLYNDNTDATTNFVSKNLALGIFSNDKLSINTQSIDYSSFTHILMHSDGLSETLQISGHFSIDDVKDVIDFSNIETSFDALESSLKNKISMVHDDISIVIFDLDFFRLDDLSLTVESMSPANSFSISLDLSGSVINTVDITQMLCSILFKNNFHEKIIQKISLITTEILSNAIEHGILDLDSTIKQQEDGFFTYYTLKSEMLDRLSIHNKLKFNFLYDSLKKEISIIIKDSGNGFIVDGVNADQDSFFGRGLSIVKELADRIELNENGNMVTVLLCYK